MQQLLDYLQTLQIEQKYINAIAVFDRAMFIPSTFKHHAYEDTALPLANGQTISQPSLLCTMMSYLPDNPDSKILEIGTGSGYFSAILSQLYTRVYTIERQRDLWKFATNIYQTHQLHNIITRYGDGMKGWQEHAPFDAIILSASIDLPPPILLEQLKDNGIMIGPFGHELEWQYLRTITKRGQDFECHEIDKVRFVPLKEGLA